MKRLFYILVALALVLILVLPTVSVYSSPNECREDKRIDASNVGGDYDCDSEEWHFVINQLDSDDLAPDKIYVTWENGDSAEVPLSSANQQMAHYYTSLNLDSPVTEAYTYIYVDWSGNFVISHGPCIFEDPTETPVPPTETPIPPTETPIPPTETPVDPTETPVEPTETPVDPTETPTEPTETPKDPTPTLPSPGGGPPSSIANGRGNGVIIFISGLTIMSALFLGMYFFKKLPVKN